MHVKPCGVVTVIVHVPLASLANTSSKVEFAARPTARGLSSYFVAKCASSRSRGAHCDGVWASAGEAAMMAARVTRSIWPSSRGSGKSDGAWSCRHTFPTRKGQPFQRRQVWSVARAGSKAVGLLVGRVCRVCRVGPVRARRAGAGASDGVSGSILSRIFLRASDAASAMTGGLPPGGGGGLRPPRSRRLRAATPLKGQCVALSYQCVTLGLRAHCAHN
jgi:hypothetical protein